MKINFTGGLIKCKDVYISPDRVMFFKDGISYSPAVACTDVFLQGNDCTKTPLRLCDCEPSDFADAFIKAQNSDGIFSVESV